MDYERPSLATFMECHGLGTRAVRGHRNNIKVCNIQMTFDNECTYAKFVKQCYGSVHVCAHLDGLGDAITVADLTRPTQPTAGFKVGGAVTIFVSCLSTVCPVLVWVMLSRRLSSELVIVGHKYVTIN